MKIYELRDNNNGTAVFALERVYFIGLTPAIVPVMPGNERPPMPVVVLDNGSQIFTTQPEAQKLIAAWKARMFELELSRELLEARQRELLGKANA